MLPDGIGAIAASHTRGECTSAQAVAAIRPQELERALTLTADFRGLAVVVQGLGVSPGVGSGPVVFSSDAAVATRAKGSEPVLVLTESRPEDLPGLLASVAVVTDRGGQTTHAAVVARALGRPTVAGLVGGTLSAAQQRLSGPGGEALTAGDMATVDGTTGTVYRGLPAEPRPQDNGNADFLRWLHEVLVDGPGLPVKVNADSAAAAARGRALGATGVGLCRTEHMFLGDRRPLLERVMIARPGPELTEGLAAVYEVLRGEFIDLFAAMDGLDVTIRLLDPPRHEFLADPRDSADPMADAMIDRLREHNPMLGVRGVRLGILVPALTVTQIQALIDAALVVRRSGGDPRPELLIPMVNTPREVDVVRGLLSDLRAAAGPPGATLTVPVGAMIETPRAALMAGRLAARLDAISLGTNDLTAMLWGLSRDDADRALLPAYQELGLIEHSPFERLDVEGVGAVIEQVVRDARAARSDIKIGICGEQAATESAVRFLAELDIDYISCSPPRIPLVRLVGAQQRRGTG
jgi:pyruvate,orthophosphate dikinase